MRALQGFPLSADVWSISEIHIKDEDGRMGHLVLPPDGGRVVTGGFEGWQKRKFTTDGERIWGWLLSNPGQARVIAFSAIAGLYLDAEDDDTALPECDSYPRCAGSDYVDIVGSALSAAGIMPLILDMQKEADARQEEDQ